MTASPEVLLAAEGLARRFGHRVAVHEVSFTARRGEVLGLLGPNGAGKTTTLRMLAGLLPPTGGRVLLRGRDLASEPPSARRPLAYLPEQVAPYDEMTVVAYLRFFARMWGVRGKAAREAADRVAHRLDLDDVRRRVIGTLSHGYRQRVAIAATIVHDPEVLLLDEPTTGLDPRQVVDFRQLVTTLAKDRLVLLSTHRLSEASQLCDRVLVLHQGRQVALGAPDELGRTPGGHRVHLVVRAREDDVRQHLGALPFVRALDVRAGADGTAVVVDADGDRRSELAREVVQRGWELLELTETPGDLEAAFLELTQ